MNSSKIPLFIFAKAPIAGRVKTRLQSHCSPQQAADIAERLLEQSLKNAIANWPGKVFLSTWLDADHPVLIRFSQNYCVELVLQPDGDLGAKMNDTFERYGYPMAIMGSDAPHVKSETLQEMHRLLAAGECAIGPSEDGGYYIIGLSRPCSELFKGLPWGSSQVFNKTEEIARAQDLALHRLSPLRDIDEWPDLLAALDQLPNMRDYLNQQQLL